MKLTVIYLKKYAESFILHSLDIFFIFSLLRSGDSVGPMPAWDIGYHNLYIFDRFRRQPQKFQNSTKKQIKDTIIDFFINPRWPPKWLPKKLPWETISKWDHWKLFSTHYKKNRRLEKCIFNAWEPPFPTQLEVRSGWFFIDKGLFCRGSSFCRFMGVFYKTKTPEKKYVIISGVHFKAWITKFWTHLSYY